MSKGQNQPSKHLRGDNHALLDFWFAGNFETRRAAAERTTWLFARAELRPSSHEWGNELCDRLNAS